MGHLLMWAHMPDDGWYLGFADMTADLLRTVEPDEFAELVNLLPGFMMAQSSHWVAWDAEFPELHLTRDGSWDKVLRRVADNERISVEDLEARPVREILKKSSRLQIESAATSAMIH